MGFGRLERSNSHVPMSEINVTPLVDVMLVLVVVLIMTAPLLASAIRLDLPKTHNTQAIDAPHFVTLSLQTTGHLFLNDEAIQLNDLENRLKNIATNSPETEIQLRADQSVSYGRVIEIIGIAQKTGLNRIGFVAEAIK